MVTQVSRIRDLTPLWEAMRQIIDAMKNSMEDVNFTTDARAVYGQPYGQGYGRALYSKYVGNEDDFFDHLYKMFSIKRVSAARMINSKGNGRGAISEIMISNVANAY